MNDEIVFEWIPEAARQDVFRWYLVATRYGARLIVGYVTVGAFHRIYQTFDAITAIYGSPFDTLESAQKSAEGWAILHFRDGKLQFDQAKTT